eukprot:3558690-Ditylum_brightwellii.AAC.1
MDNKSKAGEALKIFYQEFEVPENLIFDGSKEQSNHGTAFIGEVRTQCVDYNINEPDLYNQNPVEGAIQEIRRKWYCTMIRK